MPSHPSAIAPLDGGAYRFGVMVGISDLGGLAYVFLGALVWEKLGRD